jgi:hypothetical protein
MKYNLPRRKFLAAAGSVAAATFVGESFFPSTSIFAATPLVRRDIGNMDAADPTLLAYRKAIKAMQLLPDTNPLSWAYQAAIHGTTLSIPPLTAWNTCEHGTEFFWSWHRMYLYWFERIIRKFSGEPCWALPYWNWAPGSELQLPAPFRDTSSELYTVNRDPSMNSGAGSLSPGSVDISSAFSSVNFSTANAIIQGPHGSVHIQVGGWMGSVPTAAQDPIFYLHHSNVDRLWNLWLVQGGGRTDPLLDATWKSRTSTFFDENGNPVTMNACEVLRAALQLNYVYECEPPQVNEYCFRRFPIWVYVQEVLLQLPIPPIELNSETNSFPIELKEIRGRLSSFAENSKETLLLELDNVEAETQPGIIWEVYFGLPPGTAPDAKGPFFVGTISLFGSGIRSEAHHEFKPARFLFPLSRALRAVLKTNVERIQVTFVPTGVLIDGKPSHPRALSTVRIGKANLLVERPKEQKEQEEKPQ